MYSQYNNNLMEMQGPHILGSRTIGSTMRCVVIALIPQFVVSFYIFGARCIPLVLTSIAACVLFEALFNLVQKKKQTLKDWSAVITGIIIAFNMPGSALLADSACRIHIYNNCKADVWRYRQELCQSCGDCNCSSYLYFP